MKEKILRSLPFGNRHHVRADRLTGFFFQKIV
jgi:hypothetical protein